MTVLSEIEQTAEIRRQVLADHQDFSATGLFRHLCRKNQFGITPSDLETFFRANLKVADPNEMIGLCKQFDHNLDGIVDQHEFMKNVLSREEHFNQGNDSLAHFPPSPEVILSLLKVFELEIEGIKRLDGLRQAVTNEGPRLSLRFFEILDKNRKGYFDLKDVLDFLSRAGKSVSYSKANRVIKRLDRDLDNRIILSEWEAALQPVLGQVQHSRGQDNIFNLLNSDQQQDHGRLLAHPEYRSHFDQAKERRSPASPYAFTEADLTQPHEGLPPGFGTLPEPINRPHERTTHTLVYSKSPLKQGSNPNSASKGGVQTSPFKGDIVLSKTVTEYADGTTEVEERVYDPEGARRYRTSAENVSTPLSESKYLIETVDQPLRQSNGKQVSRGPPVVPESRYQGQRDVRESDFQTQQVSPQRYGLQSTYTYPDRERIVSPPNGDIYRREVIYPHDYKNLTNGSPKVSIDSEVKPTLQQEIITRTEKIVDGVPLTQTHVRKIYGSPTTAKSPQHYEEDAVPYNPPKQSYTQELPKHFSSPDRLGNTQKSFGKDSTFINPDTLFFEPQTKTTSGRKNPLTQGDYRLADTRQYAELVRSESLRLQALANSRTNPNSFKFSALTSDERQQLLEILKSKVRLFREVERARRELAQHPNFNIAELYQLVRSADSSRVTVSIQELQDFFETVGIRVDDKTLRLVFVRYDYDNDDGLSFFEFSEMLAACHPDDREAIDARKENGFTSIADLPAKLKQSLSRALSAVVDFELETDSLRASIRDQLYSFYNIINMNESPAISIDDLLLIVEQAGLYVSQEDMLAVVRRFDANLDGKITLEEFVNEMSPLRLTKPYDIIRGRGF